MGNRPDPNAERRRLKAKLELKSQVSAWALTFYLSKRKMPSLLKFYTELNRMPRDMRLDREQVLHAFCKSFGLMDSANPAKVDKVAFKRFANEWTDFLRQYATWGVDIPIKASQGDPTQGGFDPGGFGSPGGFGPGDGGGAGSPDGR